MIKVNFQELSSFSSKYNSLVSLISQEKIQFMYFCVLQKSIYVFLCFEPCRDSTCVVYGVYT